MMLLYLAFQSSSNILLMPYGFLMETMIMAPTLDDHINLLSSNSHKFKHRIIVKRDSKDLSKVLTGVPVIDNETEELIAFVELKWESEGYNR
jgi:hypothetical protein